MEIIKLQYLQVDFRHEKTHAMAYSEVNLDMILGAEKMAGGRNDSADWSPPAKTMLIGHQHLRLEGSQLLPGERNHGINLPFSCHIFFGKAIQYRSPCINLSIHDFAILFIILASIFL